MKPFLSFQGSQACFFSDLFTSRFKEAGLRIPFDRLRAAVSPIPKSRKEQRPHASLSRNDFMVLEVRTTRVEEDIRGPCTAIVTELKK